MTYEKVTDFIKNVGFPIGVAIFLLWKVVPALEKLDASIQALNASIQWQTLILQRFDYSPK